MKSLLLLLLLPLLACGHEHPLTDHQHEYELPDNNHEFLLPESLPFAYITRVDPPLTGLGYHKFGVLKPAATGGARVTIDFSKEPQNLTFTNKHHPMAPTTAILGWGFRGSAGKTHYYNRAHVTTDCSDPEHTGYIAVRLDWDTGSARLLYRCPDAEWR